LGGRGESHGRDDDILTVRRIGAILVAEWTEGKRTVVPDEGNSHCSEHGLVEVEIEIDIEDPNCRPTHWPDGPRTIPGVDFS
jgi:hypothetical protein